MSKIVFKNFIIKYFQNLIFETLIFFTGDKFPIWIVADMRRGTDLNFFLERYPGSVTTVRITASDNVRKERGFFFTPGIDDAESECGLDHISDWDQIIQNECDGESALEEALRNLINGC